jgi:squalene-associated FAD-dependent desaturase
MDRHAHLVRCPTNVIRDESVHSRQASGERCRVAIIGAGWAGISAAVSLTGAGHEITLFEAGRTAGGRARRIDIDGVSVDSGQHLLVGAYRQTLSLLKRIGIERDAVLLRLPLRVLVPGRFDLRLPPLPAPLATAAGLFAARGAGIGEKWRAAQLVRNLAASQWQLSGDLTVAEWLDRCNQRGTLRRHLWEPLCLAALNTPPAIASAQVFANVLRDTLGAERSAADFLLPRTTLDEVLPAPALRWLASRGAVIRRGCRVAAITPAGDGWRLDASGLAPPDRLYRQVVIATAPWHAATLLPEQPPLARLRTTLAALSHQPIATVYVRYPRATRLPAALLQLPGPYGQWVIDRGRIAPVPGQDGLAAHVLSATGHWESLPAEKLSATLHAELAAAAGPLPSPLATRVIRERRATFSCVAGLSRPANATPVAGLWLAGDYTDRDYPATLEAAVRSGAAAAAGVIATTGAGPGSESRQIR